jgi:hypothetical protein
MTFKVWAEGLVAGVNGVVVPLLVACAFVAMLWGVLNYFFLHADNAEKRAQGREFILWGVLGLALIFSVWGVVNLLLSTLGFV